MGRACRGEGECIGGGIAKRCTFTIIITFTLTIIFTVTLS
jgi:hypothetical protein